MRGVRWNSQGVELVYTAAYRSLAMAEVAVHLTLATLPDDYMMLTLDIPDDLEIKKINEIEVPEGWNNFPHLRSTQKVGDHFVSENKYCAMKVPSAVTKGDYNILINPSHTGFKDISIVERVKFPFDRRIFE